MGKEYQFGDIYKNITGELEVPKTIEEVWEKIKNLERLSKPKCQEYGSNLTPGRSVFEFKNYDSDIDKYLN